MAPQTNTDCGNFTLDFLEHFMLSSVDNLYGNGDFIFQQDLAPAHTAKTTETWFNDHGITVLVDWAAFAFSCCPVRRAVVHAGRKPQGAPLV